MSNYVISICTGFLSRALGLVGTVLLTRLLSVDILGLLTLVQTSAQTSSSLFRLGSNYSYTVLLPSRGLASSQLFLAISYSRLGAFLSIPFSVIVALYTTGSIWKGSYAYVSEIVGFWSLLLLLIFVTSAECLSELLWSIIFPLKNLMNSVLYRDPLISALKVALPILFYSTWGLFGSLLSILIINLISLLGAMSAGDWFSLRVFCASMVVGRFSDIVSLLRYGITGYIFPLLTNLLMLPLLLQSASIEGVADIGALRIGTWGAQIITVIGGSIAPVLLVNNSRNQNSTKKRDKITDLCAIVYSLLFSVACFSVGYINDAIFLGKYSSYEDIQLFVIAGSVLQSLVQLLLQCPLRPSQQLRVNLTLCFSLVVSFCIIRTALPSLILTSYTLVPFASNVAFMMILLFSQILKSDLGVSGKTMTYLVLCSLSMLVNFALNSAFFSFAIIMIWLLELTRISALERRCGEF